MVKFEKGSLLFTGCLPNFGPLLRLGFLFTIGYFNVLSSNLLTTALVLMQSDSDL